MVEVAIVVQERRLLFKRNAFDRQVPCQRWLAFLDTSVAFPDAAAVID
jgi:hypothetical protein